MLKAAVYPRYSSGLQKTTSLDDQIVLCREAAPRFNCLVLEDQIYTDHEISGTVGQRPAYIGLMNAPGVHPVREPSGTAAAPLRERSGHGLADTQALGKLCSDFAEVCRDAGP
jgi:hypothetical protein